MKTARVLFREGGSPTGLPNRYGAVDLKTGYQRFLLRALIVSSFIHFVFLGTYWVNVGLHPMAGNRPPVLVRIDPTQIGPPPPFSVSETILPLAQGGTTKIKVGIPVPVPEAEVRTDEEFPDQNEMNRNVAANSNGIDGDAIGIPAAPISLDEPPKIFVPVEKEPILIKEIMPVYPEIAQKAGLEGTVWARMWITKEGKVKEVLIIKSDSEIFNQSVIDAARQFLFTPAMMKNGPVAVWMSKQFNFILTK
jgi:TonB family protein